MVDPRALNVLDDEDRLLCPACGFPGYAAMPGYDELGGVIGTTVCPSCAWEPGVHDDPDASPDATDDLLQTLRTFRSRWEDAAAWHGPDWRRPADWDGRAQLEALLERAPHLR